MLDCSFWNEMNVQCQWVQSDINVLFQTISHLKCNSIKFIHLFAKCKINVSKWVCTVHSNAPQCTWAGGCTPDGGRWSGSVSEIWFCDKRLGQDSQVLSSGAEDMMWARDSEDGVYVEREFSPRITPRARAGWLWPACWWLGWPSAGAQCGWGSDKWHPPTDWGTPGCQSVRHSLGPGHGGEHDADENKGVTGAEEDGWIILWYVIEKHFTFWLRQELKKSHCASGPNLSEALNLHLFSQQSVSSQSANS